MGEMVIGLYVFVLATLAGREVITKVPPTLHTPLMSGANAISGIAIVGALVVTGSLYILVENVRFTPIVELAQVDGLFHRCEAAQRR